MGVTFSFVKNRADAMGDQFIILTANNKTTKQQNNKATKQQNN